MRRLLNYIDKNLLLKVASLNSVAIITRVIVGFATSKAIAYFVGPTGMALVGNLRDFMGSTRTFSTLGFYNGIVKYISEYRKDISQLGKTITTVIYSVLTVSILISAIIFFAAESINQLVFGDFKDYAFVFRLLALALPFYAINLILMAVLNGSSKFKFLLFVSIIGHLVTSAITLFLIWKHALNGALIAVVASELAVLLILIIGIKRPWHIGKYLNAKGFEFKILKNLSAYSTMALFTAATLPLTFVFIRNYIAQNIGLEDAGYWEAMNRISKYYLMFVTSLLTLYILPRFSSIDTAKAFRKEIFGFYRQIIPFFLAGLVILYFLREYLILLVFTEEFLEMKNLFFWQMLGDLIKVLAIVLSYQFLAKKMTWPYLITESISIVVLIFSSIYFIDAYGTVGATIAHFVTYIIYFGMMLLIFRKVLFSTS